VSLHAIFHIVEINFPAEIVEIYKQMLTVKVLYKIFLKKHIFY